MVANLNALSNWIGCIEHGQHASRRPNGLGQSSCGGIVQCGGILTEIDRVVSCQWAESAKTRECTNISKWFNYKIEADVIKVPPSPKSYIKQIRRGWLRQLWPNTLVRMCRDEYLSANLSRAPHLLPANILGFFAGIKKLNSRFLHNEQKHRTRKNSSIS